MHIKIHIMIHHNQLQSIKENRKKIGFKMKKFSCLNPTIYYQSQVNQRPLNQHSAMKILQAPVKTILFYLPPHYKTLWPNGEQNE